MVELSIDQIRELMNNHHNIRNICILGQVDNGRSTLMDNFISKTAITYNRYANRICCRCHDEERDASADESLRTGCTLLYYSTETSSKKEEYLVNMILPLAYTDLTTETSASLLVSDGALMVLDAVEGLSIHTEIMLRQALQEKLKPNIILNKMDRFVIELKLDGEAIYQFLAKAVDDINRVVQPYQLGSTGKVKCDPSLGNVAFGSGKYQWAFTITAFAKLYAKKFEITEEKMMQKLWGDHYFDNITKKWTSESQTEDKRILKRCFVQFIMDPICKLVSALMDGNAEAYRKMLNVLEIKLTQDQQTLTGNKLLKTVMKKWLPASECLLAMMISHLPSPRLAQQYRTAHLYQGPQEDVVAEAMRKCDPKGPLTIFISKIVPQNRGYASYAFGRIFSGIAATGQKVRILGSKFKLGKSLDVYEVSINKLVLLFGRSIQRINDVPCGNPIIISALDKYLIKTGTIGCVDIPIEHAYPIRGIKYSSVPTIGVGVTPLHPIDLPKMIEGLRKLCKYDSFATYAIEESGQHIVYSCNETHSQICQKQLENLSRCQIVKSDPFVLFKETITSESTQSAMTVSANKHNRIIGTSLPLDQSLCDLIENREITPTQNVKILAKRLVEQFGWQEEQALNIWSFGPEDCGANVIVNASQDVKNMNEIKQLMISAFQWSSKEGVLCEENARGMRFNIVDCQLHSDAIHRGGGQIIPVARRLYYSLELLSKPTLMEPIFSCVINVPQLSLETVYHVFNQKRGEVVEVTEIKGTPLYSVKAFLPATQSLGFRSLLTAETKGYALSSCVFDHWKNIKGLPLEDEQAKELVQSIRRRKGLSEDIPSVVQYINLI